MCPQVTSALRPDVSHSSSSSATFLLLSNDKDETGKLCCNLIGPKSPEPASRPAHELVPWLWLVECKVSHGYYGLWLCWYPSEDVISWWSRLFITESRTHRAASLCPCFWHTLSSASFLARSCFTGKSALEILRSNGPEKELQNPVQKRSVSYPFFARF